MGSKRQVINLDLDWSFHLGEINEPRHLSMKSLSLGGFTAPIDGEKGERMPFGPSGAHFLGLVGQGDQEKGLAIVAGTDVDSQLDASWKKVDLPHDWKRDLPYTNNPALTMNGFKDDCVAYYRRSFSLDEGIRGRQVHLHLDGILGVSDLWYNGAYLKHNESGYVAQDIDVTALSRYGDEGNNTLLVKTDTRHGAEGWWNEGAGIYRSVWLEVYNGVHLSEEESWVRVIELTSASASLQVNVGVVNDGEQEVTVTPTVLIGEQQVSLAKTTLLAGDQTVITTKVELAGPHVWTPEDPYMYPVNFQLEGDQLVKQLGVKTVKYQKDGFYLNGQRYELHGICYHQDFAGVGIAQTKEMLDYKLRLFKEAGINALRSAHHFASPDLMDACDQHGILLMNENRLLETSPWRLGNLRRMVKLSRMHPSMAFWSLSNEELVGNTIPAGRMSHQVATIIRKLDPDHILVQAELLNPEGKVNEEYLQNIDVLGVNYPESPLMGSGAEVIHQQHPDLPMMSTENASYFTTRGNFKDDDTKGLLNSFGTLYSNLAPGKQKPGAPGTGGTATPKQVMEYVKDHPYMGGTFIWLGADCYGEPSPLGWPATTSSYGIMDICGFPKNDYYYYQAHWADQAKTYLHLDPTWNKELLEIDDQGNTAVRVYTNADQVHVWVNDHDYGIHDVVDNTVDLQVVYEPGVLKAEALSGGKVIDQATQVTASSPTKVEVTCLESGNEVDLYQLKAVDKQGNFVSCANNLLYVSAAGGQIWALANGNVIEQDDRRRDQVKLFNGLALAIVRKTSETRSELTVEMEDN
ncbi:DUF4982 domain-containing protein [Limosilactobacillus fermentum]|uniref:glycoside hydrolase family 2 protein n=1 Tax=Limosilactobacillus fermentum TaxID=1613 RepID=UPI0021A48A39|nr:glycoside hydrolase family 2 TIM barrel-domain containing protein [Limosilactobacillus fermentum]MCT3437221.1 DUF4982 domain-containing protein [Limosilactobacillus fermentum]